MSDHIYKEYLSFGLWVGLFNTLLLGIILMIVSVGL